MLAIVATRSTKPEAPVPLLEAVREERASVALEPAPLGEVGTRLLLTNAFEAAADDDFARACREASGGNPFLLTELARSLSAEGARPTAGAEQSVDAISPAAVSRSVLTRLARMPADAQQLALAVAVLGDGAAIEDAAALAGVDDAAALEAAEVLAAGAIFEARQPLGFSHPLIRSALYDDISPARREREHRRSAELLIAREAAPEKIASHLLLCPPAGAVDAAAALQRAGEEAIAGERRGSRSPISSGRSRRGLAWARVSSSSFLPLLHTTPETGVAATGACRRSAPRRGSSSKQGRWRRLRL